MVNRNIKLPSICNKSILKKLSACIMATSMVVSGLPVSIGINENLEIEKVYASETLTYTEGNSTYCYEIKDDGTISIKELDGNDKEVSIPSQIENKIVTEIDWSYFGDYSRLTVIDIPQTITKIDANAFSDCNNLIEINVAEDNQYFKSVEGVLYNKECKKLIQYPSAKEGEIYNILPGVIEICGGAFENNNNLLEIKMPTSIEKINASAFMGCSKLEKVDIPENVKEIGSCAFYGCSRLEKIKIPKGVTKLEDWLFRDCSSLSEVIISEGVTEIGWSVFSGCIELEELIIPISVKNIGETAFAGCESLKELIIPESVTVVGGGAFQDCKNLVNIEISENINEIEGYVFSGCENLKKILIPEKIDTISSSAFIGCSNLQEIDVSENNQTFKSIEGILYNIEGTKLIKYPEGKKDTLYTVLPDLNTIGIKAFYGCSNLEKVVLSSEITEIEINAFEACNNLVEIENLSGIKEIKDDVFKNCESLKNLETPNIIKIGWSSFSGCSSLKMLKIPKNVTEIGPMAFSGCNNLVEIILPENLTEIGFGAFSGCSSLTEIVIPKSVIAIESDMFSGCSNLAEIMLPENLTEIGYGAFLGCSSLTEIVIPKSISTIESEVFSECSNLSEIIIPIGVTKIERNAFSGCSNLAEIMLPENLTEIGSGAFSGCSSLAEIILPENLTEIGSGAFSGCSSLVEIILPVNLTEIGSDAFLGCSNLVEINVGESNPNYKSVEGVLYNKDCTKLIKYPSKKINKTYNILESVVEIEDAAFYECDLLEKVIIPKSITSIGYLVFDYSNNLSEIEVVDGNPNYKSIEGVLYNKDCTSILRYPEGKEGIEYNILSQTTTVGYRAFFNCTNLKNVKIPESVEMIGSMAFSNCGNLKKFEITKNVFEIGGGAFSDCKSMEQIVVVDSNPNYKSVEGVLYNKELTELLQYPGGKNNELYKILPDVTVIEYRAFSGCNNLEKIIIPEKIKYIASFVFQSAENISEIYFLGKVPDEIYSLPENSNVCAYYNPDKGYWDNIISKFSYINWIEFKGKMGEDFGDTNGDGEIDIKDSALIKRYLAGADIELNLEAADVNGDGEVNIKDSALIKRKLAGWE